VYIGLTEEMVFNPPEGMEGWRRYRIEYGGFNEMCLTEGKVWLPAHVDPGEFEKLMEKWSDDAKVDK
jgi:hypothetical protein